MKKILSLFALLMMIVVGAKAAGYTPVDDEIIILKDVYDANKTDAGYSTHAAIAWGGTASTNSKKAGDPNNNGEKSKENLPCYSVKGNGKGKNITVSVSGVQKIIIYHEEHSSRYIELLSGGKDGELIGKGAPGTTFTEVELDASTDYSIFLHGTAGTDDQDFNVYAIKLISGTPAPTDEPAITKQPEDATYIINSTDYPNMEVEAVASAGDLQYQWQYMNPLTSEYANIPDQITSAKTSVLSGQEAVAFVGSFVTGPATFWVRCIVSDDNGSVESSAAALIIKNKSVATPVVDPASGTKFAESITMTATCETEGATIYYLDGNDWLELPAEGVTFTETTSTQVKAMLDGYDDSDIVYVTYTKKETTPLATIGEATTWDFANVTYNGEGDYELKNGDETIQWTYTDLDLTFTEFNSDALAFTGQYPIRSNSKKYAQNGILKFNTSVPGTIKVKFTDTGTKASATAVKRFLVVNDEQTEYWTSRENDGDEPYPAQLNVETDEIPVEAGYVTITGTSAICISYVEFTPASGSVVTLNNDGFATFSSTENVAAEGATVYYVSGTQHSEVEKKTYLVLSKATDNRIAADGGYILYGTPGATVTFSTIPMDIEPETDNLLKPTTTANGLVPVPTNPTDGSPDALTLDGKTFKTFTGATFNANKAYLVKHEIVDAMGGNTLEIKFAEATGVNGVAEAKAEVAPAKVIKNGQLFIGNFNVAGQRVQ